MIDMHSHIVFGIDDGPSDVNGSLEIIRNAKKQGIDEIILTSHFMEDCYNFDSFNYLKRVKELEEKVAEQGIDIKLYVGNEVMICPDILKYLEDRKIFTLNNSRYLLVELPFREEILSLKDTLNELIFKGYVPIIAHPERYAYFQKDTSKLNGLFNSGVLFQINAGSVIGIYGQRAEKTAKFLLKNGLVHVIGSDAHSPHRILGKYDEILKELVSVVGEKNVDILTNINPQRVIENSDEILNLSIYKSSRWWQIW